MHSGDATLKEPSAPHIEVSSGRYRAVTDVMTVAGAAPGSMYSYRTSLLTYPDPWAGRHLTGSTVLSEGGRVNHSRWYDHSMETALECAPTDEQCQQVTRLLGRTPRGLKAIPVLGSSGSPVVIRVASVVDNKPFPTLYWLVDAALCLQIDRLEAAGWIARLQARVDESSDLQNEMEQDHSRYKRDREGYLLAEEAQLLTNENMRQALDERGIGGITGPHRIRCLHTWYAAHLVTPNSIGRLVDQLLAESEYLAPD